MRVCVCVCAGVHASARMYCIFSEFYMGGALNGLGSIFGEFKRSSTR